MNENTQIEILDSIPEEITIAFLDMFATKTVEAEAGLKIKNQLSYDLAVRLGKTLSMMGQANDNYNDPIIKAAHHTHKVAVNKKKLFGVPLATALASLRLKVAGYVSAQREKERQEQLRLEAEQKKRDEAAQLKEAERLEKTGADTETVNRALEAPPPASPPPPVAAPRVHEQKGTSVRKNWKAKCINPAELVRAVADGKANASLVVPDEMALNKLAKALEGNFDVPGCIAYNHATTSFSK